MHGETRRLREIIGSKLEKNPDLIPEGCEYRKAFNNGETLVIYNMITMAEKQGYRSICDLDIENNYCSDCNIKRRSTDSL